MATAAVNVDLLGIPEMSRMLKAVANVLLCIDSHWVILSDSPQIVELREAALAVAALRAGSAS